MGSQDVVQLPHARFAHLDGEDLKAAIERNFKEVAHMLAILQLHVKADEPIWDRAGNINADGTFPAEKLTDKLVGLAHELQLANEAVTSAKIAVGAIRELHISAGEIPVVKTNFPYHQIY